MTMDPFLHPADRAVLQRYEQQDRERNKTDAHEARPTVTVTVVEPKPPPKRPRPAAPAVPPGSVVISRRELRAIEHLLTHYESRNRTPRGSR